MIRHDIRPTSMSGRVCSVKARSSAGRTCSYCVLHDLWAESTHVDVLSRPSADTDVEVSSYDRFVSMEDQTLFLIPDLLLRLKPTG